MTCPSCAPAAPRASRASPARLSRCSWAAVNAAGTVMSWSASSSRAWALRIGVRRAAGQAVPELRPERGQHQHRGAGRVPQQLPQPCGDLFTQPAVGNVEVELGLVQPHHGPRPDARQVA